MSTPFQLMKLAGDARRLPVMGISEWAGWYAMYRTPDPNSRRMIEECIDVHQDCGISAIVWSCGRSTLEYRSELPDTTQEFELSDSIGDISYAFMRRVMKDLCPLRTAIEYAHERGVVILGRLCMNRHYGSPKYAACTSRFAMKHPEYHERDRLGKEDTGRLCYAIEEVRRERIDILLEIQRLGVEALVLDFCRQMPILKYHDALVGPYMKERGVDPREINSKDPEDYMDWFQYRADILTRFMAQLRDEVRQQEKELGRPCPIIARVPDDIAWLMIAYGLDIERWFKDDLVDGTMLSPFPCCTDSRDRYPEYHVATAHKYGKVCYGGIGSKHLIDNQSLENTGFYYPKPVYELARRQYAAGADAMSLYQSEILARMPYLKDMLREIGDREIVAQRARELPDPGFPDDYPIGMDWHTLHTCSVLGGG